jgi:hypothetical protein
MHSLQNLALWGLVSCMLTKQVGVMYFVHSRHPRPSPQAAELLQHANIVAIERLSESVTWTHPATRHGTVSSKCLGSGDSSSHPSTPEGAHASTPESAHASTLDSLAPLFALLLKISSRVIPLASMSSSSCCTPHQRHQHIEFNWHSSI